MVFFMSQIALMLLFAAICGGILSYWWVRRRFRNVTDEYTKLTSSASFSGEWKQKVEGLLSGLIANKPKDWTPSFEQVLDRMNVVENKFATIPVPQIPDFSQDFSSLVRRIDSVQSEVKAIEIPEVKIPEAKPVNFGPIIDRMVELENKFDGCQGRCRTKELGIGRFVKETSSGRIPSPRVLGPTERVFGASLTIHRLSFF